MGDFSLHTICWAQETGLACRNFFSHYCNNVEKKTLRLPEGEMFKTEPLKHQDFAFGFSDKPQFPAGSVCPSWRFSLGNNRVVVSDSPLAKAGQPPLNLSFLTCVLGWLENLIAKVL